MPNKSPRDKEKRKPKKVDKKEKKKAKQGLITSTTSK